MVHEVDKRIKDKFKRHNAVLSCTISIDKFYKLKTVHDNLPFPWKDPSAIKRWRAEKYIPPVEVWWNPVKGRDVRHDGRHRCSVLKERGYTRARCNVYFTRHSRPVPISEIDSQSMNQFIKALDVRDIYIYRGKKN